MYVCIVCGVLVLCYIYLSTIIYYIICVLYLYTLLYIHYTIHFFHCTLAQLHCIIVLYFILYTNILYYTLLLYRYSSTTTLPTTDTISLVKCTDPLPLEQYFNTITAHFQTRQRIALLSAQLNDAAHQYRMVEKRLLVRYKDRNPTPLSGLDSLMKETYDRLIALSK